MKYLYLKKNIFKRAGPPKKRAWRPEKRKGHAALLNLFS